MTDQGFYILVRVLSWLGFYLLYRGVKSVFRSSSSNYTRGKEKGNIKKTYKVELEDQADFNTYSNELLLRIKVKLMLIYFTSDTGTKFFDQYILQKHRFYRALLANYNNRLPYIVKQEIVSSRSKEILDFAVILREQGIQVGFKHLFRQLKEARNWEAWRRVRLVQEMIDQIASIQEARGIVKVFRHLILPELLTEEIEGYTSSGSRSKLENAIDCNLIGYDDIQSFKMPTNVVTNFLGVGLGSYLSEKELFDMCNEHSKQELGLISRSVEERLMVLN